jgi:diketogulonate reductase-like aldo/keto reductase
VIPKSITPARITANLAVDEVDESVMEEISKLEKHGRTIRPTTWGSDFFEEWEKYGKIDIDPNEL